MLPNPRHATERPAEHDATIVDEHLIDLGRRSGAGDRFRSWTWRQWVSSSRGSPLPATRSTISSCTEPTVKTPIIKARWNRAEPDPRTVQQLMFNQIPSFVRMSTVEGMTIVASTPRQAPSCAASVGVSIVVSLNLETRS